MVYMWPSLKWMGVSMGKNRWKVYSQIYAYLFIPHHPPTSPAPFWTMEYLVTLLRGIKSLLVLPSELFVSLSSLSGESSSSGTSPDIQIRHGSLQNTLSTGHCPHSDTAIPASAKRQTPLTAKTICHEIHLNPIVFCYIFKSVTSKRQVKCY